MPTSIEQDVGQVSLSESFGTAEREKGLPESQREELTGLKNSLKQLKSIMLTLEWDLSFQALQQFDKEIAAQEEKWRDDKNVAGLLRILRALGKYIERMQGKTHPVAIKLFFAVYNGFEKIVFSPKMSAGKKKKIVLLAFERYNEVKKKLEKRERVLAQKAASQSDMTAAESPGGTLGKDLASAADSERPGEEGDESNGTVEEDGTVMPALSDFSLSDSDMQQRASWYEKVEPSEVENRLDAFFVEEQPVKTEEEQATIDLEEVETSQEKPSQVNIIDSLFSSPQEGEADQMLADLHLSVFGEENLQDTTRSPSPN